ETAALIKVLQDADGAASARDSRAEAIRRLTATTSGAIALARELGHEAVPSAVRGEVVAATKDHPATEVRDLFERFVPESQRIPRLGSVAAPKATRGPRGAAGGGGAISTAGSVVTCKSCRRLEGVGVELGPDLGKIGAKYPRPEMLQQILEPSRSVDPK